MGARLGALIIGVDITEGGRINHDTSINIHPRKAFLGGVKGDTFVELVVGAIELAELATSGYQLCDDFVFLLMICQWEEGEIIYTAATAIFVYVDDELLLEELFTIEINKVSFKLEMFAASRRASVLSVAEFETLRFV